MPRSSAIPVAEPGDVHEATGPGPERVAGLDLAPQIVPTSAGPDSAVAMKSTVPICACTAGSSARGGSMLIAVDNDPSCACAGSRRARAKRSATTPKCGPGDRPSSGPPPAPVRTSCRPPSGRDAAGRHRQPQLRHRLTQSLVVGAERVGRRGDQQHGPAPPEPDRRCACPGDREVLEARAQRARRHQR